MNCDGSKPDFTHSRDMTYKVFNRVLHKSVVQFEKVKNIENERNPKKLWQIIQDYRMRSEKTIELLLEKEATLEKTISWKIRKYCIEVMPKLLNHFVTEMNYLNSIYQKYVIQYLNTLPDSKKQCTNWYQMMQEEETTKQEIREIVKKIIIKHKER